MVGDNYWELSSVSPVVASFEDFSVEMISVKEISPEILSEADFDDTTDPVSIDLGQLSLATPCEADFE